MAAADAAPRYVVGVDLGTTNSAVAYCDLLEVERVGLTGDVLHTLAIPQVVGPGTIESLDTLPSFHYSAAPGEFTPASISLPWDQSENGTDDGLVGQFARDHGALVPGRVIASAKSWLCHSGVDRTANLLPWQGADDVPRLSPVAVSARYLSHIRSAWDAAHPDSPLAEQEFVLTIPASFDEVARELTLRAARLAGLPKVVLIEEPQAAFYAWIAKHATSWNQLVSPGQNILVCDVGGGTSDFTLIRALATSTGTVQFQRIAVGDHLILGGDNFDLALAGFVEARLSPHEKLPPRAWSLLPRLCRSLKEELLGEQAPQQRVLSVPMGGSRLIGGARQVTITRSEVEQVIAEGFFPRVSLGDRPQSSQSGFQEFGLPYAADAGITRYLGRFLAEHLQEANSETGGSTKPDLLLLNGGVFSSPLLRERLTTQIGDWFSDSESTWRPKVLDNERLDLAVARGAAYFGLVRRGYGVRISAGLPRSYYIGVDSEPPVAVCLAPAGLEPGTSVDLTSRRFQLRVGEPTEFPLLTSSVRLRDQPGDVIPVDPLQLRSLPPIRTVLKAGRNREQSDITVQLQARLSEIGTLDLACFEPATGNSWKLLFDVRAATQTDAPSIRIDTDDRGVLDSSIESRALGVLSAVFELRTSEPGSLMKQLGESIELDRASWPTSLLRAMWAWLIEHQAVRHDHSQLEARWLNISGYCLRPGYGYPLDDWRVGEAWRLLQGQLQHPTPACRAEWWVFWRRAAGGLTGGQQQALITPVLGALKQATRNLSKPARGPSRDQSLGSQELVELWRLVGSLELLPIPLKIELGTLAADVLKKTPLLAETYRTALVWSLGRIGARQPVYGPLNGVLAVQTASQWADRLIQTTNASPLDALAVMQLVRCTGDRYRDVDPQLRQRVLVWLDRSQPESPLRKLITEVSVLSSAQQTEVLGDVLPRGLKML